MTATATATAGLPPAGPVQRVGTLRRLLTPWHAGLAALTVAAATVYLWPLTGGARSEYYAAVALSMSKSWSKLVFGAMDPTGTVSLDKIPGSYWVPAIFVRVFGFSTWSVDAPNAIATVVAVVLVAVTAKRLGGPTAGLVAGTVTATTPILAAVARTNQPESFFVLAPALVAWAATRAVQQGSLRWLLVAGGCIAVAFQLYMMLAWAVWPALALAYLGTSQPWRRRVGHVLLAGVSSGPLSLVWIVVVTLTPASARPWVGGTNGDSAWEMVFGYNGLGRFADIGTSTDFRSYTPPYSGDPAALRLLSEQLDRRPHGSCRPRWPRSWCSWAAPIGGFPLADDGIPRWLVADPVRDVLGGRRDAPVLHGRGRRSGRAADRPGVRGRLAGALTLGADQPGRDVGDDGDRGDPLHAGLPAGRGGRAGRRRGGGDRTDRLADRRSTRRRAFRRGGRARGARRGAHARCLGGRRGQPPELDQPRRRRRLCGDDVDGWWAGSRVGRPGAVGSWRRRGSRPGPPHGVGRRSGYTGLDRAVLDYVLANRSRATYLLAAFGAQAASYYVTATDGAAVLAVGGFGGSDPTPTLDAFVGLVSAGDLRFVLAGGGLSTMAASTTTDQIRSWVTTNCAPVEGVPGLDDCIGSTGASTP